MLKQVAEGVYVHQSKGFLQSNTVIVQGQAGVLLIDPGITESEIVELAGDVRELGQSVVAGFSTHPHWDHLLWHAELGEVPRYGTARGAAEAEDFLSDPDWRTNIVGMLPPDIGHEIPLDLIGQITGLPAGATHVPWDGPKIRVIEHEAHAAGHAALMIEENGVLVAGDMVSDILMPMLDLEAPKPLDTYAAGLQLIEDIAGEVKVFIPGHGSVGQADELSVRIKQDRTYTQALRDGGGADDPRLLAEANKDWLPGVHEW